MKKVLSIILVVVLLLCLSACNNKDNSEDTNTGNENVSSQPGLANGDFEKPVTENTALYFAPQNSSYNAQADKMRKDIINSESVIKANGETRYVSYRGNDENDGKTPETPWKTVDRLVGEVVDTVLFERGGVYRGALFLESDTSYGAYGEGYKPTFYTGDKNYADPNLWKQTSVKNIWAVKVGSKSDIGAIYFDHGKKTALKMINTYRNLTEDYDFYHHHDNGVLYLYSSEGNPAELYDSIEIAYGHGMRARAANSKNIKIDNLCVKYAGLHGISFMTGSDNITITNCEIGWIGGSISSYGRLGNGIEFINSYSNSLVENCWIYQCYDAGYTFQNCAKDKLKEDNMVFKNSLVEYCNYNIEIFGPKTGLVTNSKIENNLLRFGGFGWGSYNRIGSNDTPSGNLSLYKGITEGYLNSKNFVITNNIFDTAKRANVLCGFPNTSKGPTIKGNTYIQKATDISFASCTSLSTTKANPKWWGCKTQAEFTASIKAFDSAPKLVKLEK